MVTVLPWVLRHLKCFSIGLILLNAFPLQVANEIRHLLKDYTKTIPTVLEIPSKDSPYDPEQDYIMQRVSQLIGGNQ